MRMSPSAIGGDVANQFSMLPQLIAERVLFIILDERTLGALHVSLAGKATIIRPIRPDHILNLSPHVRHSQTAGARSPKSHDK